ncbi:sensor histidine kinase [Acetobacterium bakii]|uniref:histidine kinase n=1 Tax=Acetobacterium bakii TaxID=52689 RepID=A0A0L6U0A9_9FIRM|nr:HAMP domain-containing sensor histidine kinase [Acetobacterium bakii]KNZ41934.1 hypothetical protein AKG39_10010 [Acetobacterium bakii]
MKTKRKSFLQWKKGNPLSIKWKLFLFLLGFCTVLLILLWLFQVVFLNNFYKAIKINEIKSVASSIEKNIESDDISTIIENISLDTDVCIEVLSANGDVLYSSHVLKNCIIHSMSTFEKNELISRTNANKGEFLEYFDRTSVYHQNESINDQIREEIPEDDIDFKAPIPERSPQQSIVYSKSIDDKSEDGAVVVINSVISPIDATVNTLRVQLYYITGFMILFSVLLALIIAKRVSKPIEAINKSAKMLAKGNYDIRFAGGGYKEISELSDTLNYTAKELSKVELLRQELIANISHDLRTPLTLISGYAEAMRDLPNENNSENAQIIVDETQRLTTLVNDVMDISKLQSGTHTIDPLSYNLTANIDETVTRMNKLMHSDGYHIDFVYDQEISLTADETRISQAFYNLLINAINYTGSDKRITVSQTIIKNCENPSTTWVHIQVKDTGEGITAEDLPYIWERYYMVDKTHKRAVTGTGLGLSIVKSIIDMHGGRYGVSSKISEGSIFWFDLKI